MTESRELYERIIKSDYCIGCGVCAAVTDSPFKMQMNEFGNIIAFPHKNLDQNMSKVLNICPFSNHAKNEDLLSEIFFPEAKCKDSKIGKYLECFAGYVNVGVFREKGSSGGLGKWLGYILLKENKIDFFVQVFPNETNDPEQLLFDYAIISDKDEALKGSKSSYYPVTLANIINVIKEKKGRYAITGIPCFIKALRLLSCEDEIFKSRIKYSIGIICGGMKSANHAKIIGWQIGINPENLVSIDFRRKYKDKSACNKIYQAWSNKDTTERFKDADEIYGTDWGSGFFKPNACDYCDDVVAETADVSFGDAWLPQFESDPQGTSLMVIRNNDILELINRHKGLQNLKLFSLTPAEVAKAQDGGFRHRREALSYRIAKKEMLGSWVPKKRVSANEFKIKGKIKRIYSLRERIAMQSHLSSLKALKNNDLEVFFNEMNPLVKEYHRAKYGSLPIRGIRKLKRVVYNFLTTKIISKFIQT
jgi:coenzyme F420 hydrogenase subunit beta